jgi:hypothetical protein
MFLQSIKIADANSKSQLISELVNPETFETLARDQYANFVLQTALEAADVYQKRQVGIGEVAFVVTNN